MKKLLFARGDFIPGEGWIKKSCFCSMASMKNHVFRIFFILLFLIFLPAHPAAALSCGKASSCVIGNIRFEGLKRTREKTVRAILKPLEEGAAYGADTENVIIQKLRASGIFNPEIRVQSSDVQGKKDLVITVKERWTLIPVPIFSFTKGGDWKAGALVIENNFLGFNKTLGLGFGGGSAGWSFFGFYGDPGLGGGPLSLKAGISAGLKETKDLNPSERVLRDYKTDQFGMSLSMEAPVFPRFFLGGGLDYTLSLVRKSSRQAAGVKDFHGAGCHGQVRWENLYYDIPFQRGWQVKVRGGSGWSLKKEPEVFPFIQGRFMGSIRPWFRHLATLRLESAWSALPPQGEFRLGGQAGSRILPMKKTGADSYTTAAGEYNMPLISFSWGTLTAKAFYEGGWAESDVMKRTFFHGPGCGMELYIKDLAIPAVEINFGWNLETGRFQFSAGVGTGERD